MSQSVQTIKSFTNNSLNYGLQAAKITGKAVATATLIIPTAIGVSELYRGYIPNDVDYLPNNDENSTVQKIIRCVNPILAFRLGYDRLWSKYSYSRISDLTDKLDGIPLSKISQGKFKLFLSRPDNTQLINNEMLCDFLLSGTYRHEEQRSRFKSIFDRISDEQSSSFIKYLINETDKTPLIRLLKFPYDAKFTAAFQRLDPEQKESFFQYTNSDPESFVQSLEPNDIIRLCIHKPYYSSHLTQTQIINTLSSSDVSLENKKEFWDNNSWKPQFKDSIQFLEPDIIIALDIHYYKMEYMTDVQIAEILNSPNTEVELKYQMWLSVRASDRKNEIIPHLKLNNYTRLQVGIDSMNNATTKDEMVEIMTSPQIPIYKKFDYWKKVQRSSQKVIQSMNLKEILMIDLIHNDPSFLKMLTDQQLNNMLFSDGGTGLTSLIFKGLPKDRLRNLDFSKIRITQKIDRENYRKIPIDKWALAINIKKCTDEQLVSLYKRIRDGKSRETFETSIEVDLNPARAARLKEKFKNIAAPDVEDWDKKMAVSPDKAREGARLLGVDLHGDWATIRRAWKKLIARHHTDHNKHGLATAQEINGAREEIRRYRRSKGLSVGQGNFIVKT